MGDLRGEAAQDREFTGQGHIFPTVMESSTHTPGCPWAQRALSSWSLPARVAGQGEGCKSRAHLHCPQLNSRPQEQCVGTPPQLGLASPPLLSLWLRVPVNGLPLNSPSPSGLQAPGPVLSHTLNLETCGPVWV